MHLSFLASIFCISSEQKIIKISEESFSKERPRKITAVQPVPSLTGLNYLKSTKTCYPHALDRKYCMAYRRIPKVMAPVTFGISSPKGPQLSGSRYIRTVKICEQSIPRNSLNEVNTSLKYFNPQKMYYGKCSRASHCHSRSFPKLLRY